MALCERERDREGEREGEREREKEGEGEGEREIRKAPRRHKLCITRSTASDYTHLGARHPQLWDTVSKSFITLLTHPRHPGNGPRATARGQPPAPTRKKRPTPLCVPSAIPKKKKKPSLSLYRHDHFRKHAITQVVARFASEGNDAIDRHLAQGCVCMYVCR